MKIKRGGARLDNLEEGIRVSEVDIEANRTDRPLVLDFESQRESAEVADKEQVENEEVPLKEVIESIMNKGHGIQ